MQPNKAIANPYASPKCAESQHDPDAVLRATTRLYRGMGWAGIAYTLCVYLMVMIGELAQQPLEPGPILGTALGMTIICGLMLAFFIFIMKTADRLGTDFDRTYRRARWLGILAASIFFPLLTIPGILAVRRLERYRKHMRDQMAETP